MGVLDQPPPGLGVAYNKDEFFIQWRRGTESEWIFKNPVLREGEPGLAVDKKNFKLGDGVTCWNELPYFYVAGGGPDNESDMLAVLNAHVNSPTPHPAYDDGPSLLLLYQNAKV